MTIITDYLNNEDMLAKYGLTPEELEEEFKLNNPTTVAGGPGFKLPANTLG